MTSPTNKSLTSSEKAYLAGFLDGDGSIILQIVKAPQNFYKHQIRVSVVFNQKKSRHWFILWIHSRLGERGYLRIRSNLISELTISGYKEVEWLLQELKPFLRIKKPLAKLALSVIEKIQTVTTPNDFLEVCKLVDKAVLYTDSKVRRNTSSIVEDSFKITFRDFDEKSTSKNKAGREV